MVYLYLTTCMLWCYTVATSGEDGRKSLMREIELGKLLGGDRQENIVQFIGCVTTQGKTFQTLCLVNELWKLLLVWLPSGMSKSSGCICQVA